MRAVVQRVSKASVRVGGETAGAIGKGFVVLLGVTHDDGAAEADYLARKIAGLRVFEDEAGKMNVGLEEAGGAVLAVSQFTLYGDVRKGRRPSFTAAARPEEALPLYERFCEALAAQGLRVERGVFQAHMEIELINDGPVTLWLDTDDLMADACGKPGGGETMSEDSYLLAEEPPVDLAIAEEMVAELDSYLVGNDLYRTVMARTGRGELKLQMSGGDLLSRLHRLQGERDALSAAEQARLDAVQQSADRAIYSLRTRFHERLGREMKARLDSLRWYLDECQEDRAKCRTEYPFEIRNRQRIEEILKQLGKNASPELMSVLNQVDRRIRQLGQSPGFVWDRRLEKVYPSDRYWYLYQRP